MLKSVPKLFEIECRGQGASADFSLCSSFLNVIIEIKSWLVAYGVPCGFLDFDRDSHSLEKNANTLGKSKDTH